MAKKIDVLILIAERCYGEEISFFQRGMPVADLKERRTWKGELEIEIRNGLNKRRAFKLQAFPNRSWAVENEFEAENKFICLANPATSLNFERLDEIDRETREI